MKPGAIIKQARTKRGWSQQRLAEQTGISQVAIKKIESGDTRQSKFLPRIAAVLDLELSELDSALRNLKAHASHIEPAAAPENHFQHQTDDDPARMPFLRTKGDGYRIDPARQSGELRQFLDRTMTSDKHQAWYLTAPVLDGGGIPPGSVLVVELGLEPEPTAVVLAFAGTIPVFRMSSGTYLIPAPSGSADIATYIDGQSARIVGTVIDCHLPRVVPGG